MTTTEQALVDQALQLSGEARLQLAERLIESLDGVDLADATLLNGARLAEERIDACRSGAMEVCDEEEIARLLEEKVAS